MRWLLNSAAKLKNTGSRFVATLLLREIEGINILVLPSVIETRSESIMGAVTWNYSNPENIIIVDKTKDAMRKSET